MSSLVLIMDMREISSVWYQAELVKRAQQLPSILVREMLPIFKCALSLESQEEESIELDDSASLMIDSGMLTARIGSGVASAGGSYFPHTLAIGQELSIVCKLTSSLPQPLVMRKICLRLLSFDPESKMPLHADDISVTLREQLVQPGENTLVFSAPLTAKSDYMFDRLWMELDKLVFNQQLRDQLQSISVENSQSSLGLEVCQPCTCILPLSLLAARGTHVFWFDLADMLYRSVQRACFLESNKHSSSFSMPTTTPCNRARSPFVHRPDCAFETARKVLLFSRQARALTLMALLQRRMYLSSSSSKHLRTSSKVAKFNYQPLHVIHKSCFTFQSLRHPNARLLMRYNQLSFPRSLLSTHSLLTHCSLSSWYFK